MLVLGPAVVSEELQRALLAEIVRRSKTPHRVLSESQPDKPIGRKNQFD